MHTIVLDAPVCMQVGPVIIAYQVSLSGRVRFVQQFVRKCIWYHFSARRCFLTGFDIQQLETYLELERERIARAEEWPKRASQRAIWAGVMEAPSLPSRMTRELYAPPDMCDGGDQVVS